MEINYLSPEKHEELKQELNNLKTDGRQAVARRLKHAKEYGDLSENSEYAQAREEQSIVESRIFELDELLKKAVIIKKSGSKDKVEVGSTVTAMKDKEMVHYTIVGSYDAKPEDGKISDESPLGQAVLHRRVGDKVSVHTPGGEIFYQITKIE